MTRTARSLCLAPLLLILSSAATFGVCNLPQPRLVCAEYSQSDAVVITRLVKSQHVEPKNDQDYQLYTFQVETVLRGSIPKQFVLWDENSSARLTFDVLRGRKYLLFVNRWPDKEKHGGQQTAVDIPGQCRTVRRR